MTPEDMAELIAAVPLITTIKLESVPTPLHTAQTLRILAPGPTIMGGMGGVYFLEELRRGARGTMTGFGYPEVLIGIWRHWEAGDRDAATRLYYRYLPILVFEGQAGVGLSIRKEVLRRRGLIHSARVRAPGPQLDPVIADDLSEVISALDLDAAFPPAAADQ